MVPANSLKITQHVQKRPFGSSVQFIDRSHEPECSFLKTHVEEGFLQSNEKRTGDARSHKKPLLQNTLAWHSSRTIVWDTLWWHSCGILLWGTLLGHFYGTLLWDTLAWHSCSTLLWHTLVKHSLSLSPSLPLSLSLSQYSETLWNTLKHSCKTLLLDTLAWHIWNTSQYYFVLQSVHTVPHSTTLNCKSCTRHFPALLCTIKLALKSSSYVFVLYTKLAQGTSQYYFVLQSLHKALPSTTLCYKACTRHFPVLLSTTKLAQGTSQHYFVLQSLH